MFEITISISHARLVKSVAGILTVEKPPNIFAPRGRVRETAPMFTRIALKNPKGKQRMCFNDAKSVSDRFHISITPRVDTNESLAEISSTTYGLISVIIAPDTKSAIKESFLRPMTEAVYVKHAIRPALITEGDAPVKNI